MQDEIHWSGVCDSNLVSAFFGARKKPRLGLTQPRLLEFLLLIHARDQTVEGGEVGADVAAVGGRIHVGTGCGAGGDGIARPPPPPEVSARAGVQAGKAHPTRRWR